MDFNEVQNKEVEIVIGGKVVKAIRPNLLDVFGDMEKRIRGELLEDIVTMTDKAGLTGAEKSRFLRDGMSDLPRGGKLLEMVWERIGSPDGILQILKKSIKVLSEQDIESLVSSDLIGASKAIEVLCKTDENEKK
jgi:hypothetical protein